MQIASFLRRVILPSVACLSVCMYVPCIFTFNNSWKLVNNVTPPSLYPRVRAVGAHETGAS